MARITFDYSKSMPNKSGKPKPKSSITPAPDSFSFPSMAPVMAQRKAAKQARVNAIANPPDTSKRLRFPSLGDPPRSEPKRSDFEEKPGLSFPSMKSDKRAERRFQAAHDAWEREQGQEKEVMEKVLRARGIK
jgi:hypothetical protein